MQRMQPVTKFLYCSHLKLFKSLYVVYPGLSMGHIYLSHSHPIAIYACPIPWDSHYIIIILIWNTIQLKLLNL